MSHPTSSRILFVCSGNICRSPMAEALARQIAVDRDLPIEVRSAGTLGIEDHPAAPHAIAACAEIDVDLSRHRSTGLTTEAVEWADYVLVMELVHAQAVRDLDARAQVVLLGTFGSTYEIPDPIGAPRRRFRRVRDTLRTCVEGLLEMPR